MHKKLNRGSALAEGFYEKHMKPDNSISWLKPLDEIDSFVSGYYFVSNSIAWQLTTYWNIRTHYYLNASHRPIPVTCMPACDPWDTYNFIVLRIYRLCFVYAEYWCGHYIQAHALLPYPTLFWVCLLKIAMHPASELVGKDNPIVWPCLLRLQETEQRCRPYWPDKSFHSKVFPSPCTIGNRNFVCVRWFRACIIEQELSSSAACGSDSRFEICAV